jgi:transcription initiation factor IIE alpha subunit
MTGTTKYLAYAAAFSELCLHLNDGEYTKVQLVEKTGLSMNTVIKWLNSLIRRKLVYICDWTRPARGCPAAIYTWGYMRTNKPRPKPKTTAEYCENYRNRKLERQALHGIRTRND